jgi:hypothetical protein
MRDGNHSDNLAAFDDLPGGDNGARAVFPASSMPLLCSVAPKRTRTPQELQVPFL